MVPDMSYDYVAFSFGAGVQSTAIALLLHHEPNRLLEVMGQLPDMSYFADTQREMTDTYIHLGKMMVDGIFNPVPLKIVTAGDLGLAKILRGKENRSFLPYFTKNRDGSQGMLLRKCTSEFKIVPLTQTIRKDVGIGYRKRGRKDSIGKWIGISTDEKHRVKVDPTYAFVNLYPLIEMGWSRTDCFVYCESLGWTPPKSRCYFCPYISDWNSVARNNPHDFQRAVEYDREIRSLTGFRIDNPCFLHRSLKPLDEAIVDQGHLWEGYQPDDTLGDFADECEGMCGL